MYVSKHHKLALFVLYSNISSTFIFDKPFRKNGHRQKKGFLELVDVDVFHSLEIVDVFEYITKRCNLIIYRNK